MSLSIQDDLEVVLAAVGNHPLALRYASQRLQSTREVVIAALASWRGLGHSGQCPNYEYLCAGEMPAGALTDLQPLNLPNREDALRSVTHTGMMLRCVGVNFRNDPEVVLSAVSNVGNAFQYASTQLRSDKMFVVSAVSANGWALRYAILHQCDREVVHRAVVHTSLALWFASPTLREDHNLITVAVDGDRRALILVRPERRARYARAGPVETRILFHHMPVPFLLPDDIVEQYILPRGHVD